MNKSPVAQRLQAQSREIRKIAEKRTRLISNHSIPHLPKDDFNKFNEIIGNPRHPATGIRSPILPFQLSLANRIRKFKKTITNKSRKIGSSEIHLRVIAEQAFNSFMGHGGMVVFGNRQSQANEFIDDFDALFHDGLTDLTGRRWRYNDIVVSKKSNLIELYSDFYLEAFPAEATALRGPKNIRCVLVSEAAHVKRLDDSKIYTALRPVIANDPLAFFMLESTPNGRRGFFYDQSMLAQKNQNDYSYKEYPFTYALDTLLTREFIEAEKKNPHIDFEQEYMCKFTSSSRAAFKEDEVLFVPQKVTNWDELI